jgi:hypothetical protein
VLICRSNSRWQVPGYVGDPVHVRANDITPYDQARDGALKLKRVVSRVGSVVYVPGLVVVVPPRGSTMRLDKKSAPDAALCCCARTIIRCGPGFTEPTARAASLGLRTRPMHWSMHSNAATAPPSPTRQQKGFRTDGWNRYGLCRRRRHDRVLRDRLRRFPLRLRCHALRSHRSRSGSGLPRQSCGPCWCDHPLRPSPVGGAGIRLLRRSPRSQCWVAGCGCWPSLEVSPILSRSGTTSRSARSPRSRQCGLRCPRPPKSSSELRRRPVKAAFHSSRTADDACARSPHRPFLTRGPARTVPNSLVPSIHKYDSDDVGVGAKYAEIGAGCESRSNNKSRSGLPFLSGREPRQPQNRTPRSSDELRRKG